MRILLPTSLLLVAAFCPTSGAAATRTQQAQIAHPTAPATVVLRVSSSGGFVAPQTNLRALPAFTLYGDGTVIVPGAIPQLFPGPAISPLVKSKLSERQVQALLVRARQAGLLARGAIGYGGMGAVGISDAPTTTVILNAAGRHVVRQAYALGAGAAGGRLSTKQLQARQALARFVASLPPGLSGARYAPHAIAVYVAPFRGQAQRGAKRIVWPLASNLAAAGKAVSSGLGYRCVAVTGSEAKTLLATLRTANEQSQWVARAHATRAYEVVARPLLPDQRGCPVATA
jgi:hypothetical protein